MIKVSFLVIYINQSLESRNGYQKIVFNKYLKSVRYEYYIFGYFDNKLSLSSLPLECINTIFFIFNQNCPEALVKVILPYFII